MAKPPPVPIVLGAVKLSELGALKLRDPAAWKARVLEALRESGGNRTHAAAALGVSHRQFARWVRELGLPRGKAGRAPQEGHISDARVIVKSSRKPRPAK